MASLSSLLLAAFPHASPFGRRVVRTLAETHGRVGGADFVAGRLGLRSRHQLARLLRREGLPQFDELCGWICVLDWIIEWEAAGTSLFKLASRSALAPPTCYRTVRRLTGVTWTEARERGLAWALAEFIGRCPGLTRDTRRLPTLNARAGS